MSISVDHLTREIYIPQADLTFVSTGLYLLDVNDFWLWLKDWEDDEANINMPATHSRFPEVTVGGVTLAAVLEVINGYTVTFEDGMYAVKLGGANNNIADVLNVNMVSLRSNNSAGLTAAQSPDLVANAVFTDIVEGTLNFKDIQRLVAAVLLGKVSGAGTSNIVFRDTTDSVDRVQSDVDGSGNRIAVIYDPS